MHGLLDIGRGALGTWEQLERTGLGKKNRMILRTHGGQGHICSWEQISFERQATRGPGAVPHTQVGQCYYLTFIIGFIWTTQVFFYVLLFLMFPSAGLLHGHRYEEDWYCTQLAVVDFWLPLEPQGICIFVSEWRFCTVGGGDLDESVVLYWTGLRQACCL